MNDRAAGLLEQYDVEVLRTRRGRGALLCDTDKGCLIFREYGGNANRLCVQNKLLNHIKEAGVQAEEILPTREGELSVKDTDGTSYILKTYREGRECNLYEKSECIEAVRLLAGLHRCMELPAEGDLLLHTGFSVEGEYEKHNRELKRVRRYLQQKGQKTWFEISLLNSFDYFIEQALEVTGEWKDYYASGRGAREQAGLTAYCHGDYQHHNILRDEKGWYIINFEKCMQDNPIRDLYLFLRKLLEKSGWSIPLGTELLEVYKEEREISAMDCIDLYYRLAYPEKFWKIVNFYYNSGKAWIPERNQEKLEKVIAQERQKQEFLDEVFRRV